LAGSLPGISHSEVAIRMVLEPSPSITSLRISVMSEMSESWYSLLRFGLTEAVVGLHEG